MVGVKGVYMVWMALLTIPFFFFLFFLKERIKQRKEEKEGHVQIYRWGNGKLGCGKIQYSFNEERGGFFAERHYTVILHFEKSYIIPHFFLTTVNCTLILRYFYHILSCFFYIIIG